MKYLILILLLAACSTHRTPEQLREHPEQKPPATKTEAKPEISIESKQLAAENGDTTVIELEFQKKKSALTTKSQNDLKGWVKMAAPQSANILVWSDKEYPERHVKLAKPDVQLAKDREKWIKDFLKKQRGDIKVDTHNMAKRPDWFTSLFSKDSKLKRQLEDIGIRHEGGDKRERAMATKAIVLFNKKAPQ